MRIIPQVRSFSSQLSVVLKTKPIKVQLNGSQGFHGSAGNTSTTGYVGFDDSGVRGLPGVQGFSGVVTHTGTVSSGGFTYVDGQLLGEFLDVA